MRDYRRCEGSTIGIIRANISNSLAHTHDYYWLLFAAATAGYKIVFTLPSAKNSRIILINNFSLVKNESHSEKITTKSYELKFRIELVNLNTCFHLQIFNNVIINALDKIE